MCCGAQWMTAHVNDLTITPGYGGDTGNHPQSENATFSKGWYAEKRLEPHVPKGSLPFRTYTPPE
jgi:hypothetical protein